MKKSIASFISIVCVAVTALAGLPQVSQMVRIDVPFIADRALISPDGRCALVSTQTSDSLFTVSLTEAPAVDAIGRGQIHRARFADDSQTVTYTRRTTGADRRSYQSLQRVDLASRTTRELVAPTRSIMAFTPAHVLTAEAAEGPKGSLRMRRIAPDKVTHPEAADTDGGERMVYIHNGHLMLSEAGGEARVLSPQGSEAGQSYLWPSLSPDGTRVLYYHCGTGAWTCALDGSDARFIGMMRAPQWIDNSTIVGQVDTDNGLVVTSSALVVADLDGNTEQLTDPALIALNPTVTADGSAVVFATADGKLYRLTLKR